jgi:hypothetical protein
MHNILIVIYEIQITWTYFYPQITILSSSNLFFDTIAATCEWEAGNMRGRPFSSGLARVAGLSRVRGRTWSMLKKFGPKFLGPKIKI